MLSWKNIISPVRRKLCCVCSLNLRCQSTTRLSDVKMSSENLHSVSKLDKNTLTLKCHHSHGIKYGYRFAFKRHYCSRPIVDSTMDEEELKHFKSLAQSWWDEKGDFEALHAMNKLRIPFIRDGLVGQNEKIQDNLSMPLQDMTIADVGSGGGILTEPLARLGAFVIGLDPVEESTKIAQLHLQEDPRLLSRVKYINGSVEDLATTESETFDAVVASEVVEHVADLVSFVESCCKLVKPGGSVFITTMNKTVLSRSLAVYAAENIFKVVPAGTHDWEKFVPPEDLRILLEKNNMHVQMIHGMLYLPVFREWKWIKDTSINYALHAVKADSCESS